MITSAMLRLLVCVCLAATVSCKNYTGYKLFKVQVHSEAGARDLYDIGNKYDVDFLNVPTVKRTSSMVVSPDHVDQLAADLAQRHYVFSESEQDVQSMIESERKQQGNTPSRDGFRFYRPFRNLADIFVKFPRYAEIIRWMKQVTRDFPELASVEEIGKTHNKKPMMVLKLSSGGGGSQKKVVWIDGAIHGREWISATTVLYLANQVLNSYSTGENADLLRRYDWIFLPVANPDGYEFSHSTDRLWRKNRRPVVAACYGVDLNRNFGIHWGETKGSVSSQGCSDQYGGRGPFSEPETINIRDYLAKLKDRLEVYLSFHSYSQFWLVPWGYGSLQPADYDRLLCAARHAVAAAKSVHGLDYKVGTLSELLYAAAGGSFDWAKANGATYSYTVELRPAAENVGPVFDRGFLAETTEIVPAGEEMWAALKELIKTINKNVCG